MPNDRNTRIAQALEPEPGPIPSDELSFNSESSPLGMWKRYSFSNTWMPLKFDTDENAFRLAWARLTEEQKHKVFLLVRRHAETTIPLRLVFMHAMDSTLAERCDWLLAVLEGK